MEALLWKALKGTLNRTGGTFVQQIRCLSCVRTHNQTLKGPSPSPLLVTVKPASFSFTLRFLSSSPIRWDTNNSKRGPSFSTPKLTSDPYSIPPLSEEGKKLRIRSTMYYLAALGVIVVGVSYAAVPLYRIFCASYSYGGTTSTHDTGKDLSSMQKGSKEITIRFFADKSSSMQWNFKPQQSEIIVTPGETALAFYRAENKTGVPVDGISTYNVIPFEAGAYFNKIQCFCFEEQRLNPGETVELPVFFYIDPEFINDPKMQNVNLISLSYTFFESKEMPAGFNFLPGFQHNLGNARGGSGGGIGFNPLSKDSSQNQTNAKSIELVAGSVSVNPS